MRAGFTRYTNVDGIDELKDAIIEKFQRDNGLAYERSQILVSTGAKQTLYNLCMAVLDAGDEAIIPAPYWVSYPDMVMLADGLPVMPFAGITQGYKITPRQLAAAITPKTRLFLLNSPCNPTGAAYTRFELRALGEVLLEHPHSLNRAIAVAQCEGPERGLEEIAAIDGSDRLTKYPFYPATLGELEFRRGQIEVAREHFRTAIKLGRKSDGETVS